MPSRYAKQSRSFGSNAHSYRERGVAQRQSPATRRSESRKDGLERHVEDSRGTPARLYSPEQDAQLQARIAVVANMFEGLRDESIPHAFMSKEDLYRFVTGQSDGSYDANNHLQVKPHPATAKLEPYSFDEANKALRILANYAQGHEKIKYRAARSPKLHGLLMVAGAAAIAGFFFTLTSQGFTGAAIGAALPVQASAAGLALFALSAIFLAAYHFWPDAWLERRE